MRRASSKQLAVGFCLLHVRHETITKIFCIDLSKERTPFLKKLMNFLFWLLQKEQKFVKIIVIFVQQLNHFKEVS